REDRADFRGQLRFRAAARAERVRRAVVDEKEHRELALFSVAPNVRRTRARGDAPVDGAHVIPGQVGPHVGELDAAALEHARVLAGQYVLHQSPAPDLELADLSQDVGQTHGTRSASRMRSRT